MSSGHSTKQITDVAIKRMKPESYLSDAGQYVGLRVERGKKGRWSFVYRYRSPIDNKIKGYTFGSYPEMKLTEARQEFEKLRSRRDSGICLATERKKDRLDRKILESTRVEQEAVSEITVRTVVEFYLSDYIEDKNLPNGRVKAGARKPQGQREVRNLLLGSENQVLRRDGRDNSPMLLQLLGDIPMMSLGHKDVLSAILSVVERGANVSAGNMLREFTAAVDYSIGELLPDDFVNPCYQAKGVLSRRRIRLTSTRGSRVLNDTELRKLLLWLPGSLYTPTQKNVIRFTLMTGCRTGEVVGAEWRDVDLDNAVWFLRDTKTNTPRNVQLSSQAVSFLQHLRLNTGEYLFPSQKTGKPIQQKTLTEQAWHMRKKGRFLDIENWTPHDLRRSVRTGLARLGCPNEIGEAVLGHSKGGIEGVYNLHRYEAEARGWLQIWNDHLDMLLERVNQHND